MASVVSLDVHPIVDELTKARHTAGSMNTATMTFVLFFDDATVAGWARERTRAVANKHPSRVIVFDDEKEPGDQHAEPSATRGEWIEVGVKGSTEQELAGALAMLALPEAPVVVMWLAARIAHDDRFVALARMATTVIVSSSAAENGSGPLRDLISFVESHPEISVQDIAYLRLAAWKETIAEFFDEPDLLEELTNLRSVDVTAGSEAEMYYLLGWLASRMAWTPASADAFSTAQGAKISFAMVRDGKPRRLSKVELRSDTVTFTAEVHPDDQNVVCLKVSGAKQRDERCSPLHSIGIATLTETAILAVRQDEVFVETLAMAKNLLEKQPQ